MSKPCNDELRDWDYLTVAEDISPNMENLELYMPAGIDLLIHFRSVHGEPVKTDKPKLYLISVSGSSGGTNGEEWRGVLEQAAPGSWLMRGVLPGTYQVYVNAEGYCKTITHEVDVPEYAGQVECTTTLIPTGAIEGRVLFADGTPAQGVMIDIECEEKLLCGERSVAKWRDKSTRMIHFSDNGIRVRSRKRLMGYPTSVLSTDSQGRFIYDQAEDGKYFLFFRQKGREILEMGPILLTDDSPSKHLEVELPPLNGVIEGKVRDAGGRPVKGGHVVAWNGTALFNVTRSDEEGKYRINGLPDGKYVVGARCIQYSSRLSGGNSHQLDCDDYDLEAMGAFNAEISQGSECRLDLIIQDPWSSVVCGKVFSPGGGIMPPRHRVKLEEWCEDGKRRSREYHPTDLFEYNRRLSTLNIINGESFCFEELRAGLYKLQVNWVSPVVPAPETKPYYKLIPVGWVRSKLIELSPSMMLTEDIELALSSIQGTVMNRETYEPVQGAAVEMKILAEEETDYTVTVIVGRDGRFEIHALPSGPFELSARHGSYEPFGPVKIEFRDNQNRTDVCLRLGLKEED
jgi:hypothetical protein